MYAATVLLQDERLGQKSYEIRGFATLPEPLKVLRVACQSQDPRQFFFPLEQLDLQDRALDGLRFALLPLGHQNSLRCAHVEAGAGGGSGAGGFELSYVPRARFGPG